jgi:hypothetical protein
MHDSMSLPKFLIKLAQILLNQAYASFTFLNIFYLLRVCLFLFLADFFS